MPSDSLASAVRGLPSPWQGFWFDSVDSTQDVAREAARHGTPGQSIFVADFQSAGRGRQGRTWTAEPGTALLMSLLFRERGAQPRPWRYTSLASLALVETIQPLVATGAAAIKWPNDVMLDGRKVAGVLAETSFNGDDLQAIVGVGLNVATAPPLPGATALVEHADSPIDRGELLLRFVERLEHWLHRAFEDVHATWQGHLWARGQRLRLVDLGETNDVVVLGVREDGALLVQMPDRTQRVTTTGELLA